MEEILVPLAGEIGRGLSGKLPELRTAFFKLPGVFSGIHTDIPFLHAVGHHCTHELRDSDRPWCDIEFTKGHLP